MLELGRWTVAFASALMNAVQAGAFFMTPTTLMPEIVADFKLDLSVSTVPIAVGKVAYVLLLIPGGILVDHFGPRRCVLLGIMVIACLMTAYATLVRTFTQLITVHILLAFAASVSGVPVYSIFIAQWFRQGIGLAMGLVLAGYSAAGTLVPALLGPIADAHGWRIGMCVMAGILWFVGIPVAYFHLNEKHDEHINEGEVGEVDESAPEVVPSTESSPLVEKQPFELRTPRLTYMGFAMSYFLLQYCVGCFFENIMFYLHKDCGIALATASLYFSALNLASFSAKLAGGVLGDRYNRFHVASAMSALAAVAIMILFCTERGLDADYLPHLTTNQVTIAFFALLFGFGYGGVFNSLYSLVPLVFGRGNLGATQSSLFGIGLIGNAIGSVLTGVLRSQYGTYQVPFLVSAGACLLNFFSFNLTRLSLSSQTKPSALVLAPQPYERMEELRLLQNLEEAAAVRLGLTSPERPDRVRPNRRLGASMGRFVGHTPSSELGIMVAPPRSLQELRLGDSLAGSVGSLYNDDGMRPVDGFPIARDWSNTSLRVSLSAESGAGVGSVSVGGLKQSGTMENLIRSGVLSACLETPGYLGSTQHEQALPRVVSEPTYDSGAAERYRRSPESEATPEW